MRLIIPVYVCANKSKLSKVDYSSKAPGAAARNALSFATPCNKYSIFNTCNPLKSIARYIVRNLVISKVRVFFRFEPFCTRARVQIKQILQHTRCTRSIVLVVLRRRDRVSRSAARVRAAQCRQVWQVLPGAAARAIPAAVSEKRRLGNNAWRTRRRRARRWATRSGPTRAFKRPSRFPMAIHFVWRFCMGAQRA